MPMRPIESQPSDQAYFVASDVNALNVSTDAAETESDNINKISVHLSPEAYRCSFIAGTIAYNVLRCGMFVTGIVLAGSGCNYVPHVAVNALILSVGFKVVDDHIRRDTYTCYGLSAAVAILTSICESDNLVRIAKIGAIFTSMAFNNLAGKLLADWVRLKVYHAML